MKNSWANWTISDAPDHVLPCGSTSEKRCFITCPNCKEEINVAAESAMKNRSLTARQHLKSCKVTQGAGSSEKKEQVPNLPPSKLKKVEQTSVDTGVQSVIADKDKTISTLAASESKLLVKNEDLKSQVSSMGNRLADLEARNRDHDNEVSQLKANMDMIYRMFSRELGFPERPPWPSFEEYNDKLVGLKKAAAVNTASPHPNNESSKRMREKNEQLKAENTKLKRHESLSEAFRALVKDDKFHRQTMLSLHPDKLDQLDSSLHGHANTLLEAVKSERAPQSPSKRKKIQ